MANLKNITELPLAESAEGLNLIVNDNGSAKQIAASAVGAQADWAETDETSPAFVKNKPVEEWDLDMNIIISYNQDEDAMVPTHTVNHVADFASIKEKVVNGINPKFKISCQEQIELSVEVPYICYIPFIASKILAPAGFTPWNETQEGILINIEGLNVPLVFMLLEDGSTELAID